MNMKLPPDQLKTRKGRDNVLNLVKTFFDNDGYHIQFNVLDTEILRDAQKHPEKYRDLVVRVAGFSAFFTKLHPGVQNEIIERTLQRSTASSAEIERNRYGVALAPRRTGRLRDAPPQAWTDVTRTRAHSKGALVTKEIGHASFLRRIAIMVGAGYVPGMNAVVMGAALAAGKLGWEMVGIRDGFDGLLHPERYPEGGLVTLSPELVENLDPTARGAPGPVGPGRSVPCPPGERRRDGRGSGPVRRAAGRGCRRRASTP